MSFNLSKKINFRWNLLTVKKKTLMKIYSQFHSYSVYHTVESYLSGAWVRELSLEQKVSIIRIGHANSSGRDPMWESETQPVNTSNKSILPASLRWHINFFQWTWWSRWSQAKVHVWKLYISLHIKTTFSIRRFKSSIHKQKDGGKNGDTHSTQQINLGNKFITWSLIN